MPIFATTTCPAPAAWSYRLVRWFIAALFLVAGVTKLWDPHAFAGTISDFGLVYPPLEMPVAIALPLGEVIVGLLLLLDFRAALSLAAAMLIGFIAVLAYGQYIGLDIQCGCLGPANGQDLPTAIRMDLLLLLLCCYLYFARSMWSVRPRRWRGVFRMWL